ncbi:ClpP/crotonase [Artomyces pyxidatus]|uniref:ClpP/crotonase n=1 Tax=Artomyces pyxidatus TaxID=48021 RepID=A0ACB8SQR1_9AGAM|nr:ClpP/crotonase [Artomyces pyxidatus]
MPINYPLRYPTTSAAPLLTLSHPTPTVWQIELHNGDDSRLTKELINNAFKPALDYVEREWRESWHAAKRGSKRDASAGTGALVIVGKRGQDKFFSNGFDYPSVVGDPHWFPATFDPLLLQLLTFPIPTVAAINGHCFAAGAMIALACDYRVMSDGAKRNTWLCMNEVDFGAAWPVSFAALVHAKIAHPVTFRKMALEGHRFTPSEAREAQVVDELVGGGTEGVLSRAVELAQSKAAKAKGGVWGTIKTEVYRSLIETTTRPDIQKTSFEAAEKRAQLAKL